MSKPMTYDEFIKKIKEMEDVYIQKHFDEFDFIGKKRSNGKDCLKIEWCIGGQSGGSCYDTDDHVYHPIDPDTEPEFNDIDKILEVLAPDISFIQYKSIVRDVLKQNTKKQNDYYGNHSNYAVKYILLEELFEALQKRDLI